MGRLVLLVALVACGRIGFDDLLPVGDEARGRLSVGDQYACAIRADNRVWCWGENRANQLGIADDNEPRATPVQVPLVNKAVAVAAGSEHACAITDQGAVWCWGHNETRRLGGDRTGLPLLPNAFPEPRPVDGLPGPALEVSAGYQHTCALFAGGDVWCWGGNSYGELGRGTITDSGGEFPGVVPNLAPVAHLSIDDDSSCVLHVDGGVSCWGENSVGHVGDGMSAPRSTPYRVPGVDAEALALGGDHVCTVASDGGTVCWGSNLDGQLGVSGGGGSPRVRAGIDGLVAIAAGFDHTCGIDATGQLWCWGKDDDGELGNGDTTDQFTPVRVDGIGSVVAVDASSTNTCALAADGAVWCWGFGARGAIGDGRIAQNEPRRVGDAGVLGVGERHTCSATNDFQVRCWGDNSAGQLGDGTMLDRATPVTVAFTFPATTAELALGDSHTCARLTSGEVWCWGANGNGQLGDGTTTSRSMPAVVNLPSAARQIASASRTVCANLDTDALYCWGNRAGDNTTNDRPSPFLVASGGVVAVQAGTDHVCSVEAAGDVSCWGDNGFGQLGNGSTTEQLQPVLAIAGATEIAAGGFSACAQTGSTVQCWGRNDFDLLQGGGESRELTPIPSSQPMAFSLGAANGCNASQCWGSNYLGVVGDGTYSDRMSPSAIVGLPGIATQVGISSHHICAVAGGDAYCWGNSESGEVGFGPATTALVPVRVAFP